MNKILKLRRKDGIEVEVKLKELGIADLDKIMELQKTIINGLENKELYADTGREDFEEYIKKIGKIIGYVTNDNELIAMGVYVQKGYESGNYGHDIEISGEDLLKVGQIESTVVREEYRGNRLQKRICEELEKIAKEKNTPIICATASPINKFSVNTFLNLGYEIKKEKIKYGGLRRYVLMKELK